MSEPSQTEHVERRDTAEVVADDERLSAVQDRIDEAKDAAGGLRDDDVLPSEGDPADADDHGTFEPAGDGTDAGRTPSEGRDAGTPGAAGAPDDGGTPGTGAHAHDGRGTDGA